MTAAGGYGPGDLLGNRRVLVDTVLPTAVFAVLAIIADVGVASAAALGLCGVVLTWRLLQRQPLVHAVSGLGGVLIGVVVALVSGDAEGFFVPGIVANVGFGLLCAVSVLARRPALAYTSAALYRWPLEWYWHPQVRPAYSEVTWLWAAYYLAKGLWQYALVVDGDLALLATVRLVTGWPSLVVLVGVTYAYVTWRLDRLGGPDVESWRAEHPGDTAAT
jgi:hypothetical protein